MAKLSNIFSGAVFGRLTVLHLEKIPAKARLRLKAVCACSCGITTSARVDSLGLAVLSCGCLSAELTAVRSKVVNATHGMSKTNTYKNWSGMIDRTTNPNHPKSQTYYSRRPPERWLKFENFFADMGVCPEGWTLERVDNAAPYGPDNCRWAGKGEQSWNRNCVRKFRHAGQEWRLSELLALTGISRGKFQHGFYAKGLPISEVLGIDVIEITRRQLPASSCGV